MSSVDLYPTESTLRRRALEKLGQLSATKKSSGSHGSSLVRLCDIYAKADIPNGVNGVDGVAHDQKLVAPMSIRELEVLLSLCRAAPAVRSATHAERLVKQLGPYLEEIHDQSFRPSPHIRTFHPSPWELVAHDVTLALLAVSVNHESLRILALSYIKKAVDTWLVVGQKIADGRGRSEDEEHDSAELDMDGEAVRLCVALMGLQAAMSERTESLLPSERFSMIQELRSILSEEFMIKLEARLSSIRNASSHYKDLRPWKRVLTSYASTGRPLGAMILQHSFMRLLAASTSLFIAPPHDFDRDGALDFLLDRQLPFQRFPGDTPDGTVNRLAGYVVDSIRLLEADADFLRVSSVWQQRLAHSTKAYAIKSFLYLSLFEDAADADVLMGWLEAVLADHTQLADDELAQTTLKAMVILAKTTKAFASSLGRSLPRLIVQSQMMPETASVAADCLARVLLLSPQDMQISTLYSLGNILSAGTDAARANANLFFDGNPSGKGNNQFYTQPSSGSSISLGTSHIDDTATVHGTVVQAVVRTATRSNDGKIISLAISMLVQKLSRVSTAIDIKIVQGSALLGLRGSVHDLRPLLRLYARVCHECLRIGNTALMQAILDARLVLARGISKTTPLYEVYLAHLLDTVVSTTGAIQSDKQSVKGGILGAEEIAQILKPLAVLISSQPDIEGKFEDPTTLSNLTRDAWYNLVAHDFTLKSPLTRRHAPELETLALYSPSLVDPNGADARESGVELNTVLRRNMNPAHTQQQKQALITCFPEHEHEIKSLDYAELTFLNAAHLIAGLRAEAGSCTRTMEYFYDSKFKSGALSECLVAISKVEVETYVRRTRESLRQKYSAPELAGQLVIFLQGCCHRIPKVQHIAIASADRIISQVPSVLCQKVSLFAMLELLTLMWMGCLDEETEDVEWKSDYSSKKGGVSVQLSDDFELRRTTLTTFLRHCRQWVSQVIDIMPLDLKGLLQTYLSDFEDNGAYGHVALGRSFALEMGCLIPKLDFRLGGMDARLNIGINSASDFMAQYTTRQEYRTIDNMFDADEDAILLRNHSSVITHEDLKQEVADALESLQRIQNRLERDDDIDIGELRPALRRAAALLCRSDVENRTLVHLLVCVPCIPCTRESVKLGVALWMGVVKENSRLESQILVELMMNWERILQHANQVPQISNTHPDPFFVKQEFAPTDKDAVVRRQQLAGAGIAPLVRIFQYLASQFHASRFTWSSAEKIYIRNIRNTMLALKRPMTQPLARELHFRLFVAGARTLANATILEDEQKWLMKDLILSAGLRWFIPAPRWSFGGNKLQVKAEIKLLADALAAIDSMAGLASGSHGGRKSLRDRHELLVTLLRSEIYRLGVWLTPLDSGRTNVLHLDKGAKANEVLVSSLLPVAWAEDASLAIQLAMRFHSDRLQNDVRALIVSDPRRALDEPDALPILLGVAGQQPSQEQLQIQRLAKGGSLTSKDAYLQYLLFWAPVNPITAVNYFLPIFGNHPYIIQYAVRALESHSIDVTFFYVPQIVQTLRYDGLGYVARYIVETAQFSQLFAHQIIWNMKANAFKDEDATIPDDIKPTLDVVMDALIASFSPEDKDFYEREFDFFNKVTGISGTLRPFIKRPKPEKKQKIEEELRKIQIDVGVYLPSNPDGIIIGIDRKSGKPLQSHAKAPFMATFRIRKEIKFDEAEAKVAMVKKQPSKGQMHQPQLSVDTRTSTKEPAPTSVEVWQSAIFKVGDDCRQDVLALQMIAAFRNIFNNVGLDVFVFPYRVTATAPGCGVIDVLPNSISRDMLGREQVNGLYEYFISHFGSEDSLAFQKARANFIKSMAAYSVISYLLQFKDRHNGNIMIDDQGHIEHIDYGYLLDIAPGGVKFERAPFKLTGEMVAVMGGSSSANFRRFEELCVKSFLAVRPYVDKLASLITPMLESGLPCFKPETIKHFRERFVLERSEREAAEFMRFLVKKSEGSYSTVGYDRFQLLTNGIPY
ncbi:hypothetical protein CAC42_3130 [Sphaceloma murrayae]|uniref:1-phosphatidylinositol 4-kinase n=1 Tax=Sphaceloma murrayae TaxID=2082308 RepID=A0A2K1QRP4_9PEZI|nr:hypothetical protein CAC42_3130 [Sphaceloma murrayae]